MSFLSLDKFGLMFNGSTSIDRSSLPSLILLTRLLRFFFIYTTVMIVATIKIVPNAEGAIMIIRCRT
jgi:hypothetical protein